MINIPFIANPKISCVRHFLYFPTQALAGAAAKLLKGHERHLEVSRSACNSQWLLLICDTYRTEQIFDQARASFAEMAESFNGEYDGWEFEIRNAIH